MPAGVRALTAMLLVIASGCVAEPEHPPAGSPPVPNVSEEHAKPSARSPLDDLHIPQTCRARWEDGGERPLWNATISEPVLSDASVVIAEGKVVVVGTAVASAFDVASGRQLWRTAVPHKASHIQISGERNLVVAFDGFGAWALDGETGRLLWSSKIPAWQAALSADGQRFVVAARNLTMFDAATGEVEWVQPWLSDDAPIAGPVGFYDRDQRVIAHVAFEYEPTFRLATFDAATGSMGWNVTESLDAERTSRQSAPHMQVFDVRASRVLFAGWSASNGSSTTISQEFSLDSRDAAPIRSYRHHRSSENEYVYGSLALRSVGDDVRLAYLAGNYSLDVVSSRDGARIWNATLPMFANFVVDDRADRIVMAGALSGAPLNNASQRWAGYLAVVDRGGGAWCSLVEGANLGQIALAVDDGMLVEVRRASANHPGWIVRAFESPAVSG